jgi:hypothetical protein
MFDGPERKGLSFTAQTTVYKKCFARDPESLPATLIASGQIHPRVLRVRDSCDFGQDEACCRVQKNRGSRVQGLERVPEAHTFSTACCSDMTIQHLCSVRVLAGLALRDADRHYRIAWTTVKIQYSDSTVEKLGDLQARLDQIRSVLSEKTNQRDDTRILRASTQACSPISHDSRGCSAPPPLRRMNYSFPGVLPIGEIVTERSDT